MDREHWKKMLPYVTAFANGETIKHMGHVSDDLSFMDPPELYTIAKPKERVPLEAEDWIKDGPWWIRFGTEDMEPAMVVRLNKDGIIWFDPRGLKMHHTWSTAMRDVQRRNATSDWMPCWKEKE